MEGLFIAALGLAIIVPLSWLSWISLQSLIQARLLFNARQRGAVGLRFGDRVALHGVPLIRRPLDSPWSGCLWYRCQYQVLRGSGKSSRWVTEEVEEDSAEFGVQAGGREVEVAEPPTEFQACESRTEYGDPGCLGMFYTRGDRRTISRWLSIPARVTVVGRLEVTGERCRLVRDSKAGLLVSPLEPASAAWREVAKGVLGLLLVTAAVVAGLLVYSRFR